MGREEWQMVIVQNKQMNMRVYLLHGMIIFDERRGKDD